LPIRQSTACGCQKKKKEGIRTPYTPSGTLRILRPRRWFALASPVPLRFLLHS
jgi:hypothetical protein